MKLKHRLFQVVDSAHNLRAEGRLCLTLGMAVMGLLGGSIANAVVLTPTDVYLNVYHLPIAGGAGLPQDRASAFTVLTNGVVDRGGIDRIDTWAADNLGVKLDFVGLRYATPSRFDEIVIEQGTQFFDGGDWEAMPKIYILKDPTLVDVSVEPNMIPQWVEVAGVTTSHVFPADTTGVVPGQIRFDLSAVSAEDRTGWGWAVGGVDGNDTGHFISLTEVWAEGESNQAAPVPVPPTTLSPANVVSNTYGSVGRNGHHFNLPNIENRRGQAFAAITNGVLDRNLPEGQRDADGFDNWINDASGAVTDFAGLLYYGKSRFDTITVELGNQFGDGGDWEEMPRIFILKNPVDTNMALPESDPANWHEVFGAVETSGHTFSNLVTPGAGGTITFDLSSIHPGQRTGYGWAVGGVDGNANAAGVFNFISITELSATGAVVPEPSTIGLLVLGCAALVIRRKIS